MGRDMDWYRSQIERFREIRSRYVKLAESVMDILNTDIEQVLFKDFLFYNILFINQLFEMSFDGLCRSFGTMKAR